MLLLLQLVVLPLAGPLLVSSVVSTMIIKDVIWLKSIYVMMVLPVFVVTTAGMCSLHFLWDGMSPVKIFGNHWHKL